MVSTSKIVEVEESPKLLERLTSLKISDKESKATHQREKCHKLQLEKKFVKSLDNGKGKDKELVHPEQINSDNGNVRVFEEIPMEERLNWGTESAGDDQSDLDDEIAESAGILETGYRHSSLFDDRDPNESMAYNHYELSRQVAPSSLEPQTDNSQQPLFHLVMSSLASKLDLINDHFASCSRCKENAELNLCNILGDSGASQNFTNELKDFTEYEEIKNGPSIQTASKDNQLQVHSQGAVFLTHEIFENSRQVEITTCL